MRWGRRIRGRPQIFPPARLTHCTSDDGQREEELKAQDQSPHENEGIHACRFQHLFVGYGEDGGEVVPDKWKRTSGETARCSAA